LVCMEMTSLSLTPTLGLGDIVPVTQGGRAVICILLVVGFLPSLYLVSAVETMTTLGIRVVVAKLSMSVFHSARAFCWVSFSVLCSRQRRCRHSSILFLAQGGRPLLLTRAFRLILLLALFAVYTVGGSGAQLAFPACLHRLPLFSSPSFFVVPLSFHLELFSIIVAFVSSPPPLSPCTLFISVKSPSISGSDLLCAGAVELRRGIVLLRHDPHNRYEHKLDMSTKFMCPLCW